MSDLATAPDDLSIVLEPTAVSDDPPVVITSPPRNGRARRIGRAVLPPAIMFVVLLGVYSFFSARLSTNRQFLMPSLPDLWTKGLADAKTRSELWDGLKLTARIAFQGLAIAIVAGGLLGILMFRFRWLERATYPFLVALQAVPVLAIAPLLQVAFGFGVWPKTMVCVIIAFFPIPTTLLLGLRAVDDGMVNLFKLQGASWTTTLRKLALPGAMPALFAGFRISAGLSVVGAIVGELFFRGGQQGLGSLIIEYRTNIQYEQMYAALVWSSLLSIGVFVLFTWLGNRLFSSWADAGSLN